MLSADTHMFPITQSQTTFDSSGHTIGLDCYLPTANGHRFPAVIGLHGSGGGHASMSDPAGLLAEKGFAVYVLHYFDRTGTTGVVDKQTAVRHFPLWGKTVWDAISFVERQEIVDGSRIGLMGFSLGAYLALSVAAVDSRVQAVAEFFGGIPKEMKFFMRRLCPVLILHGDADPTVPVEEAYHLQEVLENRKIPYEMQIYPGVGHAFTSEIWQDARGRALAFLQKYLSVEKGS
jgi:carboxymethylenebutenolidase